MRRKILFWVIGISVVFPHFLFAEPKKVIGVIDFENKAGAVAWVNLGQDLADMLSHALVESGKFVVVERPKLDAVLREQQLRKKGFTKGNIRTGSLEGAQVLITGAVTEFEQAETGGLGDIRVKAFKFGLGTKWAHVGLVIRGVDVNTGEVIFSERIEKKVNATNFKFGWDKGDYGINTAAFKNTPLGKALQEAIKEAVNLITIKTEDIAWQGKVMKVSGDVVYITGGEDVGIENGSTFLVLKTLEELTDPDTGEVLGVETKTLGKITVVEVQEKFSKAKTVDFEPSEISRGDIVKLLK